MVRRRRGALLPTILILVALVILVIIGANFWTDLLWYDSVGFRSVFMTELLAKVLLFFIGGLIAGGAGGWRASRLAPAVALRDLG
jgi:uncharacterized membrane protein (UPF0182 family)